MLAQLTTSLKSQITNLVASNVASVYVADETDIQYASLDSIDGLKGEKGEYKISSATNLQVEATENRSWGYQWAIEENTCGSKLVQAADKYDAHPAPTDSHRKLLGAGGGQRTWMFATPGEDSNHMRGLPCEVTFVYKRPWLTEPDTAKDRRTIVVTVV